MDIRDYPQVLGNMLGFWGVVLLPVALAKWPSVRALWRRLWNEPPRNDLWHRLRRDAYARVHSAAMFTPLCACDGRALDALGRRWYDAYSRVRVIRRHKIAKVCVCYGYIVCQFCGKWSAAIVPTPDCEIHTFAWKRRIAEQMADDMIRGCR